MQAVVALVLVVGLVGRDPRVVVNAGLALVGTFIPGLLARDLRVRLGPGATVWITAALCLHVIGMAGAYEAVGWWDHLTHVVSASLVAAVAYVLVTAVDRHVEALYLPPRLVSVLLVVTAVGLGVVWEALEYVGRAAAVALGTDPVLVQYGLGDTMLDLVFDAVGGGIVAAIGRRRLDRVVGRVETRLFGTSRTERRGGPR